MLYAVELHVHLPKLHYIMYVRDSVALQIYVALRSQALFSDVAPRGSKLATQHVSYAARTQFLDRAQAQLPHPYPHVLVA